MLTRTLFVGLLMLAAAGPSAASPGSQPLEEIVVYGTALPDPSIALHERMAEFVHALEQAIEAKLRTDLALLSAPTIRVATAGFPTHG